LGGAQGQVTDMMIQINEFVRLKERVIDIFVEHTGQDRETIKQDTERDIFFTAEQAVEYGLIDSVFTGTKSALKGYTNGHKASSNGHS
jgi:ATP-dependent Clp protease, protease subunit